MAAASLGCLIVILAAYWGAQVALQNPAVPTPATTQTIFATPVASANTPVPGATQLPGATPTATKALEPADVDSLSALLKAEVNERDLITLTHRLKKVTQTIPLVVNATPPAFKVGDKRVVWVSDQPNKKNFTTTATLRYVTPHVYERRRATSKECDPHGQRTGQE